MGRAWQFWGTVLVVTAAMAVMYFSSGYYAERTANGGKSPAASESAEPAEGQPAASGTPAPSGE